MLKTIKVNEDTFNSLRSLQFALEQRTRKSISKGALVEVLLSKYVDAIRFNTAARNIDVEDIKSL